jgi:hypothetical protein
MGVDVEIHLVRGLCLFRYAGVITLSDIARALQAQADNQAWTMPTLIDASEATGVEVTFRDVSALRAIVRAQLQRHGPRGPVAAYVPCPVLYQMARLYAMSVATVGTRFAAFRTVEEAEAWLEAQECGT